MKSPITILVGSDAFLIQRERARLKKSVLGDRDDPFCTESFSAKSADIASVLDACQMFSMTGGDRLVILTEAEALDKAELVGLQTYFDKPSPSTHFLIILEKIDRRLKAWQKAVKNNWVTEVKIPYPNEWPAWVSQEIKYRKLTAGPQAVQALADATGVQPMTLVTLLDQLITYIHPRTNLETKDISAITGGFLSKTVFDWTDYVGKNDVAAAMKLLDQLILHGENLVRINMLLARHYRLLLLAKEAGIIDASGRPERDMAKLLGVHPFFVKDYLRQAQKLSLPTIKQIYGLILQADSSLKGSPLDPCYVMSGLLLAMVALQQPQAHSKGRET